MTDPQQIEAVLAQLGWLQGYSALVALLISAVFGLIGYIVNWRLNTTQQKEIEQLRSQLSTNEQRVQAILSTATHIQKAQFEVELEAYQAIWPALVELRNSTLSLRPVIDHYEPNQSEEDRKAERLKRFAQAYNECSMLIEKNSPFYSTTVYAELDKLRDLFRTEGIEYQYSEERDRDYWDAARNNAQQIASQIEVVSRTIRLRLQEVTVIE